MNCSRTEDETFARLKRTPYSELHRIYRAEHGPAPQYFLIGLPVEFLTKHGWTVEEFRKILLDF